MKSIELSRTRTRVAAVLLAIVAGIGLSGLIGAPAQAAYGNCVGDENGARVCFNPDDELLRVCDTKADGYHASAAYRGSDDSAYYEAGAYGGNGTCTVFDFDMPENTAICYFAMTANGDDWKSFYYDGNRWISAGNGARGGVCPSVHPDDVIMD